MDNYYCMTDGDFLSWESILDVFERVELTSEFLSAIEVEESLKPAAWLLIGQLAEVNIYLHHLKYAWLWR